MKKDISIALVVLMIVGFLFCSTPARAADELIVKATSVEFKTDKNGKEYCAIRFDRTNKTAHLQYEDSVIAIIPSWQVEALKAAKSVKPGQMITMAGNWNTYNGNDSFKVKALQAEKAVAKK